MIKFRFATSIPTLESCHSHCRCDISDFKPVCGSDGLSYISSCMAGCRNFTEFHVDNKVGIFLTYLQNH